MGKRIVIDIMDDGAMFIGEDPDGPQLLEEEEAMEEAEEEGMMDGEAEEPEMEDQEPVTEPVADERELMMRLKEMIANATEGADAEEEAAFEAGFEAMR